MLNDLIMVISREVAQPHPTILNLFQSSHAVYRLYKLFTVSRKCRRNNGISPKMEKIFFFNNEYIELRVGIYNRLSNCVIYSKLILYQVKL